MVVIDSITHHIRAELRFWERDVYIEKTCRFLKHLALKFNVTIMIANQVTDKPLGGIFSSQNGVLFKMNFDYQTSWLVGWDDVGTVYRQLMVKKKQKKWAAEKDTDTYEAIGYPEDDETTGGEDEDTSTISIKDQLRSEKKRLFESKYRTKVSKIKTIPSLGLPLLNFIDARIVLKKEFIPILNEDLIDEFSVDLGIDTSSIGTSTPDQSTGEIGSSESAQTETPRKPKFADVLASNDYLANRNFETQRSLKIVFSPLVPPGVNRECNFEIWKGGIRAT
ncbi:DEKNAAC104332 [Brettanomyces naardenensis]|uniref:DEKNAAC104332 n=1 Tax=Brettanomyces naardenensis TaxID=13370 RepID=A0A448YQL4_BRENA|nr:DEKNAAC104332 [Brettanomyces naardenensis]